MVCKVAGVNFHYFASRLNYDNNRTLSFVEFIPLNYFVANNKNYLLNNDLVDWDSWIYLTCFDAISLLLNKLAYYKK